MKLIVLFITFCGLATSAGHCLAADEGMINLGEEVNSVPERIYDEYLGADKDNIEDLKFWISYLDAPDRRTMSNVTIPSEDRFKAYLATRRLADLPKQKAAEALPLLLQWYVGLEYKPTRCYQASHILGPPEPPLETEKYPADLAVVRMGKIATQAVLDSCGARVGYGAPVDRAQVNHVLAHRAEVLAAIEGREKADEMLCAKLAASTQEYQRENIMIAIASLRARKGLPLDAETPQDKFEQELKRVKEELASEKPPETPPAQPGAETPATITPAPPEAHKPFPWYYIVIVAAILALTLALILTRKRKK